jgi:hypothetical protein
LRETFALSPVVGETFGFALGLAMTGGGAPLERFGGGGGSPTMLLGIMTTGFGGGSLVSCGSVGGFGFAAGFMDDTFVAILADAFAADWPATAARPFALGFALAAFLGPAFDAGLAAGFEARLVGLAGFFMESDAPSGPNNRASPSLDADILGLMGRRRRIITTL